MFVEDCSCATVSIKVSGNGDSVGVPIVESSSCINIRADKYKPSGYLNIHSRYKKDVNCVRFLIDLIDWQRSNQRRLQFFPT